MAHVNKDNTTIIKYFNVKTSPSEALRALLLKD